MKLSQAGFDLYKIALDNCLQYILDSELDDFWENPSDNHVYYHAFLAMFGVEAAQDCLNEANEEKINNLELEGNK